MSVIQYILIVSVCLSIFYLAFRLIYKDETNFKQLRLYLMGSILISLLVPVNNYTIEIGRKNNNSVSLHEVSPQVVIADQEIEPQTKSAINWSSFALNLYFIVCLALLGRIVLQVLVLTYQYLKSDKLKQNDCVILLNHRFKNNFSFFNWIFVTKDSASSDDLEQIIAHEKVHASQVHSFDLIVMELLTAVMWFNPLIWMMKNTIQLVHEYLADEGALNTGIDKLRYQALLINQITEEKLICLSSSFNHALIKKRMIMMTTNKIYQKTRLKVLAMIPLSVSLLLAMACLNGLYSEKLHAGITGKRSVLNVPGNKGELKVQNPVTPYDTIKKKTIIKIINTGDRPDTTITETIEIIASDDTASHFNNFVWHAKGGELADSNKVMYYFNEEVTDESNKNLKDTVTILKVVNENKNIEVIKLKKPVVIIKESSGQDLSNTLVIIDGVEYKYKNAFKDVDPDQIETVTVIKNKDSIKKYTTKNYESVIVIHTKSAKK